MALRKDDQIARFINKLSFVNDWMLQIFGAIRLVEFIPNSLMVEIFTLNIIFNEIFL